MNQKRSQISIINNLCLLMTLINQFPQEGGEEEEEKEGEKEGE